MARAGPAAHLPADWKEAGAQPASNAADTAAVLPANFRKSRLETVDESLPMAYLLSVFGESIITKEILSIPRISITAGLIPRSLLREELFPDL